MTATVPVLGDSVPVPEAGSASAAGWPSARGAYYTAFMLALAVAFAEIDRTAMQLLVKPIKDTYHLSDSSMGFLLGPAPA